MTFQLYCDGGGQSDGKDVWSTVEHVPVLGPVGRQHADSRGERRRNIGRLRGERGQRSTGEQVKVP